MGEDQHRVEWMPQLPVRDRSVSAEYPVVMASRVVSRFDLPGPVETYDFPEKGNINQHTFLIASGSKQHEKEFLLQRINQQVFTRPEKVMEAMIACLGAQNRAIARGELPPGQVWETIRLVPTRCGESYLTFENRRGTTYWRLMERIVDCRTFKSLSEVSSRKEQLYLATQAGRGLAIYCDLTSDMDISALSNPLPGYRDTRLYYDQLSSILRECRDLEQASDLLPGDQVVRNSTAEHFVVHLSEEEYQRRRNETDVQPWVELVLQHRDFGLTLLTKMESGHIRRMAIHGDTKLDNFLFSTRDGQAKALIDLDTIMPHTWLADWGDMVRSLCNVAGEKTRDLSQVRVDMEIYRAVADGFLSTVRKASAEEIELMCDAVRIIALELGLRFLTDYLRGDTYFLLAATDPLDLNKLRAQVQLTLFQRLTEEIDRTRSCVESLRVR